MERLGYFVFGLCILLISCDGNIDLTPPTTTIQEFIPTPTLGEICGSQAPEVFNLKNGDKLSVDVLFSDDENLSQYKIDIHNNFDCHGHGGGSAPSFVVPDVENQTIDWAVLSIENISGSSASVNRVLTVPENVTAGNYHFHIQVVDESGNDNPAENIYSIKILNSKDTIKPVINASEPSSTSFTAKKGENIQFQGTVSDNEVLSKGGNGVLYLAYTDLSSGNTFTTNEVLVFDKPDEKTYDFSFDYKIPTTLVPGDYRFSLGANDGVRNVGDFMFFDVKVEK